MSLQNSKFPSKLESAEMADETEFFYTSVSKQPVIAGALVSVNDLHAGLSSFVFRVKQITQNPLVAIPCGLCKDAPTPTTANARMRDSGRTKSAQGCADPNDRILTNPATLSPAQQAGYYFFGAA